MFTIDDVIKNSCFIDSANGIYIGQIIQSIAISNGMVGELIEADHEHYQDGQKLRIGLTVTYVGSI